MHDPGNNTSVCRTKSVKNQTITQQIFRHSLCQIYIEPFSMYLTKQIQSSAYQVKQAL